MYYLNKCICVFVSNAFASIVVYNADDTNFINTWKNNLGGNEIVLETFESAAIDWYTGNQLFSPNLGTFDTNGALIGQGGSSYNSVNNTSNSDPYFRISNDTIYGRTGGDKFLDSADITKLTLDLSPQLTNLWFYIQDPSDQGAATTITANGESTTFTGQPNGANHFVGISINGTLQEITWDVTNQNDGFGLDNFGTVAHAPVPGAALLLASGMLGLGWMKRRSDAFSA